MNARRRARPAEAAPDSDPAAPGPAATVWADGYEGAGLDDFLGFRFRRVTTNAVGGLVQYTYWHHRVWRRQWGVTDPDAPVGAVLQ